MSWRRTGISPTIFKAKGMEDATAVFYARAARMRSARALLNRYGSKSVPTWGVIRKRQPKERGRSAQLLLCFHQEEEEGFNSYSMVSSIVMSEE